MLKRGRPPLVMTKRRRQVLLELADLATSGQQVSLGQLVRRCGLYDRSSAKRILRDLRKMAIPAELITPPARPKSVKLERRVISGDPA